MPCTRERTSLKEPAVRPEGTRYQLAGIVYFGNNHFSSRHVDPNNIVWFNDNIIQGRRAAGEGPIANINMKTDPNGKVPDGFRYKRSTVALKLRMYLTCPVSAS